MCLDFASSSSSPDMFDSESLNSRMPLPSDLPTSGSFLGPRTTRAMTRTTMSSIGPMLKGMKSPSGVGSTHRRASRTLIRPYPPNRRVRLDLWRSGLERGGHRRAPRRPAQDHEMLALGRHDRRSALHEL